MGEWLHPAVPWLAGALLVGVVPSRARRALSLLVGVAGLVLAWTLPEGARAGTAIMGQPLVLLHVDALGRAFAIAFSLIGVLGMVYALDVAGRRFHIAAFTACAAALGVVLAGDWITLYLSWEALAVSSFALIADGGTLRAAHAAYRYLLVHLVGGALLLGGIVWHWTGGAGPLIASPLAAGPAALVLLAFAINAAIPPLHAWLTDAYPESSPAAGVLLSALATKSAVYALARVFPGTEVLAWAGAAMALYGVVFAVMENDLRRLLGYHIVSQVGYMVAGVGLGTPLAVNGAVALAFCHILYKGLLFMSTGAVLHATGRRGLSELGGLGRAMPATLVLYMVGALSISGAPPLNGFVSKSLIVAAAHAEHARAVEWMLQLAGVGTFLSVGLKLPVLAFGGVERGPTQAPVPPGMLAAMTLTAALCLGIGLFPSALYALLPHPVAYAPYSAGHVLEVLEALAGTAVGFVLLRPLLTSAATVTLDMDRVYRAAGRWIVSGLAPALAAAAGALERAAEALVTFSPPALGRVAMPVGYSVMAALAALGLLLAARLAVY
ncbi:MAG: Na(+)/H(+) antiporter subunit D [Candidatus Rokuibacteriota bacterium]